MRHLFICLTLIALGFTGLSCSDKKHDYQQHLEGKIQYEELTNAALAENRKIENIREMERQIEFRMPAPPVELAPIVPTFNPLDEVPISITAKDQPLHEVLFVVARNAGLNLVIEPGISLENTVTISFEAAKSSTVVETLLRAYDLGWTVKDNVLYVQRFTEKTFNLGFLNSVTEANMDTGGDIFGAVSDTSGSGGLTGNFNIATSMGKGVEDDSLYGYVKASLTSLLGATEAGTDGEYFTLDPIVGSLYVRTTPRKMKAVANLVNDLRSKLSKQIVIDARILEVQLSDNFQFGVQWDLILDTLLRSNVIDTTTKWAKQGIFPAATAISSQSTGVIPSGDTSFFSTLRASKGQDPFMTATVEALQTFGGVKTLSNMHIRTKHGQPALITSGSTERYVSEVTSTTTDGVTEVTATTASAFSGVMMGVYSYINDKDEVDLQIFPIKSKSDLTRTATIGTNTITLPSTAVQNVSTSLRVRSGDTVILGGLIEKDHSDTDKNLPGASDVPVLNWLFKNKVRTESIKELIIIMHIRVIG
jgi:MSHA biogenesis protein MshL